MRSSSAKVDKKAVKSTRPYAIKKKLVELKQPVRDTISETISFVIKGKLTPIKPILIDDKFDILGKTRAQNQGRISKKRKAKAEPVTNQKCDKQQPARNAKQKAKAKSKVQTETAKKASAQPSSKKLPEAKPPVKTKYKKIKKPEEAPNVPKSNAKKAPVPKKSKKKLEVEPEPKKPQPEIDKSSEIKKQQTIEELLKQVNEEIRETKKSSKLKKQKTKLKKDAAIEAKKSKEPDNTKKVTETKEPTPSPVTQSSPKKSYVNVVVEDSELPTIKTEVLTDPPVNDIPDELPLNKLTEILQPVIKKEPISDKEEQPEIKPVRKTYKKIKTTPKMTIMKKRVMTKRFDDDDKDKKYKTKLFGFWNGPKRHRVASLNALAKVHCLYENESRANILDTIEDGTKLEYTPKKETSKKSSEIKKEVESSDESASSSSSTPSSPVPTRTLRTGPGLRGAGKHWDMHSSFSSSDDVSDVDELPVKSVKREKPPRPVKTEKTTTEKAKSERKRCRKQSELVMDLKDMVVRKRMASLNASAILAASYSVERRQSKSIKSDDSDSYDGSSEEYFAASDTEIKQEDDVKKEEDRKLIEVHTTPNKKVAVILNQDTDVTITGVYVNSTTRSTHHEGFCSIAGMQYRISATSHTQTAATAVSTETLLQSSSGSAPDSNSDSMPSSKSYTPLDALSNMQPPPGPGIQHNHPVVHGQQHLGPPHQHVLPLPPHQLSPGLRHSCSSAFSSPHSTPTYQIPHHPPLQGEQGFVHAGYYQPAGPLITVPTGHGQPPPPTSLSTKSVPLSETSPSSTTPSVTSHDPPTQVPPSNSNGGDSSDSDVIITSVTTAKDHHHSAPAPPAHHQPTYRYSQYPPTPPGYSYTHYPPYPYSTPPPTPSYAHHELCYSYKYPPPTSYRRYLTGGYYPTTAAVQELYPPPAGGGQGQQTQQVVAAAPPVSAPGSVAPFPTSAGGPPPPTLIETYPAPPPPPQATLIETYPPPSTHYYPPQPAYGPAPPPPPSCYTHPQQRAIPFINATYQSCPCPMQSCPKNVHTGPLTGDSKRSNMTSISKDSMPLPPVALALPLEPVSATGPPSPARGSAGMPPPPSPAGATYHQPPPSVPPPPTTTAKQEPPGTIQEECKKRKARVGKAMVRSSIQQNTMLLMCNPTQSIVGTVKREIESPKEKEGGEEEEELDEKKEILRSSSLEEVKPIPKEIQPTVVFTKTEDAKKEPVVPSGTQTEEKISSIETEEKSLPPPPPPEKPTEEILPPVVSTVAENVKMKNMKRKLSVTNEKTPDADPVTPKKKPKLSSYKCLIKKNTTTIKINNGKRKLIEEALARNRRSANKSKKSTVKRKLSAVKETGKRPKLIKPLGDSNSKQASKSKTVLAKATKKPSKKQQQQQTVNCKSSKTAASSALDTLISKNNMERTIDSVVRENRTSKESALKAMSKCGKSDKDAATTTMAAAAVVVNKKSTNNKNGQNKVNKSECKKAASSRRKSKTADVVAEAVTQVPRKTSHLPKWSNGWRWEGEPYEGKVFINSDEMTVVRKCYPAMLHETGDKIVIRDCVLLKAGPRKNDLPYVAKIAALWENPEDGEMMMSLLWYYRPEHTEQGRLPTDQPDEVFASRHKDSNSVACIDDKCYVLTFNEYCRYRKRYKRIEEGIEETLPCIPNPEPYPRSPRQPPTSQVSPEMVFFCRRVYDFRQKRIMKNPT